QAQRLYEQATPEQRREMERWMREMARQQQQQPQGSPAEDGEPPSGADERADGRPRGGDGPDGEGLPTGGGSEIGSGPRGEGGGSGSRGGPRGGGGISGEGERDVAGTVRTEPVDARGRGEALHPDEQAQIVAEWLGD